jgi:hypothetical protein
MLLYHIILHDIILYIMCIYIYICIFGEKGQGGLAVFPRSGNTWCSPSSLDKVWLAALDFWRTPRPQALWQMGQNQQERPKKSIKQILFDKAPMCVDECLPSIICKMTPGHWFQDISILQFLEDASSQSSWFRLDKKKISHCLWLILCGLSRRYTLWRK